MLTLKKSMVRNLLEYCCPWYPSKINDIQELESVQKVFTARINGIRDLHYWDILQRLSLMSLQRRRERFILIFTSYSITIPATTLQFVSRPLIRNLVVIPSACRHSSAANQSMYDSSFAVIGTKLWNTMPYHLICIGDRENIKCQLT